MPLLLPLLLLQVAAPAQTLPIPEEAVCANAPVDDARPYTLCLAETQFEQAEAEMELQLKVALARLQAARGSGAADRLGGRQRDWIKRRDRQCEAEAAATPSTQVGRNTLACQTEWTRKRTAELKALVAAK